MGDKLEKFIKNNRHSLDVEQPPDFIWRKIRKSYTSHSPFLGHGWIWKAASVAFFCISMGLLYLLIERNGNQTPLTLGNISEEYAIIENEYTKQISSLTSSIDFNKVDYNELGWLISELDYLEKVNMKFRQDINENVDRERLIRVLIDYYEKKIKILRKIELEINRNNYEKNQSISS